MLQWELELVTQGGQAGQHTRAEGSRLGIWRALVRMGLGRCRARVWEQLCPCRALGCPTDPMGLPCATLCHRQSSINLLGMKDCSSSSSQRQSGEEKPPSRDLGLYLQEAHPSPEGAEPPQPRLPGQRRLWIFQPCAFAFKSQAAATLTGVTSCL